jgi:hypothetical protein
VNIFLFKKCPSIWIRQIPLDNFKIHQKNSANALGKVGEEVKKEYPQFQKKLKNKIKSLKFGDFYTCFSQISFV